MRKNNPESVTHAHLGLLLVWNVRGALERKADLSAVVRYILHGWDEAISAHLETEGVFLLPETPEDNLLRAYLVKDHPILRERIQEIRAALKQPPSGEAEGARGHLEAIQAFTDRLHDHIRFEEREVFPWAEAHLSPERLEALEAEYHRRYKQVSHPPPL